MYELTWHRDAEDDLNRIYDEDPRNAARVDVMVEELQGDCNQILDLAVNKKDAGRKNSRYFEYMKNNGVEIWRLKFWDVQGAVPYRILYAFHDAETRIYILAVMHRDQNYEEDHDLCERIIAAYHELGIA